MAGLSSSAGPSKVTGRTNGHITEDEASLYDRQIRLWGLEAQNRMKSSTILVLSLRSLAHEVVKNLVLAGIGRLIIMDEGVVTEEDLGGGFLFREEDGAVGKERITAASPQITSLNPLVNLTALPTLAPFVRDPDTAAAAVNTRQEMVDFLHREQVDVVVACDMTRPQMEAIDDAARRANVIFYGAGTYGFYGYVFADLGKNFETAINPPATSSNPSPSLAKMKLSYPSLTHVLDRSNWGLSHTAVPQGGSPYRELTRSATRERAPMPAVGMLALWDFEQRHGRLPAGEQDHQDLSDAVSQMRTTLGVNPKAALVEETKHMVDHLSSHSCHFFPPTLAILGGILAQDVLRALSKKDKPIANLLTVDSMGGHGTVARWAMDDAKDA